MTKVNTTIVEKFEQKQQKFSRGTILLDEAKKLWAVYSNGSRCGVTKLIRIGTDEDQKYDKTLNIDELKRLLKAKKWFVVNDMSVEINEVL